MTTHKVIWAGLNFIDHFYIVKNNKFTSWIGKDGGIYNCKILSPTVYNQHISLGCGTARFTINKYGTDREVDFYKSEGFYSSLDKIVADWLHIAYIDALPGLDLSKLDLSGVKTISCDFCNCYPKTNINEVNSNLLKCDYIFDNYYSNNKSKFSIPVESLYVEHDKTTSCITKDCVKAYMPIASSDFVFTTGAGDKWASFFIESKLSGQDNRVAMKYAHLNTRIWLEDINAQI